ncbi:MAG: DUF4115 domain-containing protein [Succinivibrio sp.]|nr:DUF4115 domain-containing protein [Succinivibrio sp.]
MSKRFKGLRNRNRSEDKAEAIAEQEPSLKELTAQGLISKADTKNEESQDSETAAPEQESLPEAEESTAEAPATEAENLSDSSDLAKSSQSDEPKEMVNGDDPDKIPVKPTLSDDQVPNMPGAILRHAREMLGMSQREVANELKLRVNTISDLEHDRLNQPTAAPFASAHIANYARLVNIDPDALLSLYRQNVNDVVTANNQERAAREPKSGHGWLLWSILGLAVVGVAGYYFLPSKNTQEQSGTLMVNDVVQASEEKPGQLDLNLENSEVKTEIVEQSKPNQAKKVDENTRRAQEQALALGTNEINEDYLNEPAEQPQGAVITMPSAGSLKLSGAAKAAKTQSTQSDQNAQLQQSEKPVKQGALPALAETKPQPQSNAAAGSTAQQPQTQEAAKSTAQSSAQAQTQAPAPAQAEPQSQTQPQAQLAPAAPASEQSAAESAPAKVSLASSLKDISGSAKLRGRQGLESMNKVTVAVKDAVALRITDSRGKALCNKTYKAGDRVVVNGIPPIKVAVSDSSKIKVTYMGGQVSVPSREQVIFTLPTK